MTHWSIPLDLDRVEQLPGDLRATADLRIDETRALLVFRDRFSALKAARRLGEARVEPLPRLPRR